MQEMWKQELGIQVSLLVRDLGAHAAALRGGQYDLGYFPLIPGIADPLPTLQRFTTGAPDNYPHWSDAAYDQLVAQAEATANPNAQGRRPAVGARSGCSTSSRSPRCISTCRPG